MVSILLYIVIIGAMMYFLMIRPAKKQQEQKQQMMDSLTVGDEVVMVSGLHGVVSEIDETNNTVTIDVEGVLLVFERMSVAQIKGHQTGTGQTPTEEEDTQADSNDETVDVVTTDEDTILIKDEDEQ
ncbi:MULTISPECIES: preprotein translocase subunit YajC [Aerococcus]|uniref:preprotein translocase subunit YajC n=1 Tax=Aerococcus TaxID=1375 RepID=UPI000DCBF389|nr:MULTISPECIES: preprotein translocase subunit YajC [Aerococcus]KAA9235109.1 preprotein translocase subunit YajC [Aerococcus mictus]MDK6291157.1 preprotein translocase subunit YajC [Aerococcus urinae]MDK6374982.1 preprotein translocase subunit YajC [Aerococcus urinae]MDK6420850.1 preprotein translocase subunit YajC [Aerococcus urinae]MDK8074857.1 preprotein translocase subunit YajC [Aerococcus urinae]